MAMLKDNTKPIGIVEPLLISAPYIAVKKLDCLIKLITFLIQEYFKI